MISFSYLPNCNLNKIKESLVSNWLDKLITTEGKSIGEINYIFCDDDYLLQINQTYLNHDTLTDIITFPTSNDNSIISGEIFISISRVRDNLSIHDSTFFDEFCRVLSHGVLHLVGYNDFTNDEKIMMRSKEDYFLNLRKFKSLF